RSRGAAGGVYGAHDRPPTRHSCRNRLRHEPHRRRVPRFEPGPAQTRQCGRRGDRGVPARIRAQGRGRGAGGRPVTPVELFGVSFQNPVLLASGTAGFGREVCGVIDLDALGGIVTKAVTPDARRGHAAPRVAEFAGGMLNAVGLANPGLDAVRAHDLPWLATALRRARVLVNGAGGVSGPALLPIGVLATRRVREKVAIPVIGVGGIRTAGDAREYLAAGASLVAIGTAALADPRVPERIARELARG